MQTWYCGRERGWLIGRRSPKARCYGNQLNFGRYSQTSPETTFTLCPGVRQRIRRSWSRFQNIKWQQSVYIVYKFGELPSNNLGVYAVKTRNFRRDLAAIWRRSSFGTLAFWNELEDRNSDFSKVIGNHFCASCRNLVRFGSVTPEFEI